MGRIGVTALGLGIGLACAGAAAPAPPAALAPGDHDVALEHGGRTRRYLVHVPPKAGEGLPAACAVVLSFHGGGGTAAAHQAWTELDPVADAAGFVAVYPDGTGRLGRRLLTWNAGPCCGSASREAVDDVGFVLALLEDLAARTPIDPTRVYATGLSNGAMMAYRLAAEHPERIAAIAPVAGALSRPELALAIPVPVMHFHSADDPRAPYAGGLGPPFPWTRVQVEHPPVDEVVAQWRAADGCPEAASVGPTLRGEEGTADAAHTATRSAWGPCRGGAEVVLWKLGGAGHVWPGAPPRYREALLGPATRVVDANVEMVRFFQRFSRPDAPPFVSATSRNR